MRGHHTTPSPLPPAETAAGKERANRPVQRPKSPQWSRIPRGQMRRWRRTERPLGGTQLRSLAWGGDATPPEESAELLGFHPARAHLLLQGVYGDFPHHNNGLQLGGGIADDPTWQRRWCRLAAQSASWYATSSGAVRRRFTAILAAEWRGVFSRSWNSERPLVFAHVVLTKTLGVRRAREIWARITRPMDLWERGQHTSLLWDAEAEGAAREGRAAFSGEEEDDAVARSFHKTVLSGKLRQAVCRETDKEGGGCLLPGEKCTKLGDRLQMSSGRSTRTCVPPPAENPTCAAFEEYGEVPEIVPLDFTEDDVMWVTSKLFGAAGALVAEAIELRNWLLCFGCAS